MPSLTKAKNRTVTYIVFVVGSAVALTLVLMWRLVNSGKISLTTSEYMRSSDITLFLWPSSLMLMEVDPLAPLNLERSILYATAILLNGAWYSLIAAVILRIGRAFGKANAKRES